MVIMQWAAAIVMVLVGCKGGSTTMMTADADPASIDAPGLVAPPTVARAWRFGGAGNDFGHSLTASNGDLIVSGHFMGPVDFGGGAKTSTGQDAFVVGLGPNIEHRYSIAFGNADGNDYAAEVIADTAGNIYVLGSFFGQLDFGGNNRETSAGSRDCVLVSFTAAGVYRWSERIGGSLEEQCDSVALDAAGNVFVAGGFRGTATFGDGAFASAGLGDLFIASYSAATGNHRFTRRIGSASGEYSWAMGMAPAGDFLCITGATDGNPNFGGVALANTGYSQAYIACYETANLAHRFSQLIGGQLGPTSTTNGASLVIDSAGQIYLGGFMYDTLGAATYDLGGGPQVSQNDDGFLVSFDATGAYRFSHFIGGPGEDTAWNVALGPNGPYVVVDFDGVVDVGSGPLGTPGEFTRVILAYTPTGALRWASGQTGLGPWELEVIGTRLWGVGELVGTVDVAGTTLTSAGGPDVLVVELDGL